MTPRGTSTSLRPGGAAHEGPAAAAGTPAADPARAARVDHLGTETVFAVSADAAALAAQGRIIFPFHLGDPNIPTPANIAAAAARALCDGKTTYCPNAGIPELRDVISLAINREVVGPMTPDEDAARAFLRMVRGSAWEVLPSHEPALRGHCWYGAARRRVD